MDNNNNPKSTTRKYSTTTYTPRSGRGKKHNQNKLIFFILLAVLILALIVAIAFVIADLVGPANPEGTDPISTDGTGTPPISEGHAMSHAYDGDKTTYMLSVMNQSAGSYFSCEFASAEVGSISFISSEEEFLILSADIQLRIEGQWVTVWEYDYRGVKSCDLTSGYYHADGVRVLLKSNTDTLWAINELSLTDKDGIAIPLSSPSASNSIQQNPDTTPGGIGDESTTAPDTPSTTAPVTPETTIITVSNENLYTGSLILVNSQYQYKFPASTANLLNLYNEYYANNYHCNYFEGSDIMLEVTATRNLFNMLNAMYTETGLNKIILGTGYRSYETQQSLADRYPATAALPGYSEHHTGLGIDMQGWIDQHPYPFDDANATVQQMYAWINANAYKYGYVRRFAPDKDMITGITSDRWHFRYVGAPHAYYMTSNNLCLEEYLAALEAKCMYGSNNHLLLDDVDGKSYEIYFVPASAGITTDIPVPSDPSTYTISGNNYSGFIVTITRN